MFIQVSLTELFPFCIKDAVVNQLLSLLGRGLIVNHYHQYSEVTELIW